MGNIFPLSLSKLSPGLKAELETEGKDMAARQLQEGLDFLTVPFGVMVDSMESMIFEGRSCNMIGGCTMWEYKDWAKDFSCFFFSS